MIKDTHTKRIYIHVTEEDYKFLKQFAQDMETSVAHCVRSMIKEKKVYFTGE